MWRVPFFSLWFLLHSCAIAVLGDFIAPSFEIDLALPPQERWQEITKSVVSEHGWEHTYEPLLAYFEGVLSHDFFVKNDKMITEIVIDPMPKEYRDELTGVFTTLVDMGFGDKITLGEIGLLQLYYELNPSCTAMLVENGVGNMLHGRNMDYSLPGLPNITVAVSFTKDEKVLYQSATFVGYVGIVTGMRNNGWSIQQNRDLITDQYPLEKNKALISIFPVLSSMIFIA